MWWSSISREEGVSIYIYFSSTSSYTYFWLQKGFLFFSKEKKSTKRDLTIRQVVHFNRKKKKWHLTINSRCLKTHISLFSLRNLCKNPSDYLSLDISPYAWSSSICSTTFVNSEGTITEGKLHGREFFIFPPQFSSFFRY